VESSATGSVGGEPGAAEEGGSSPERAWMERRERGSAAGIRFILIFTRIFGRRGARLFLRVLIFYYALFAGDARRASRAYFARLEGVDPKKIGFWRIYSHLLRFAQTSLDRLFLVRGRSDLFSTTHTGVEHLERLHEAGRGAILLGAHLGSFEAMRAVGSVQDFPINIVAYWQNARMITRFLEEAGADFRGRVIEIRPGDPSYIFAVQEAIEAGEMVAILGDRIGVNEKTTTVDFLGAPARLPVGPYTMAAVLKCPIYLTFGLYRGGDRYDLYCEPLCERLELPRRGRQEVIAGVAQRYADRLVHYCRQAPDNWFNFYDFWGGNG
jgi:predicted LPLAT superfamily acyltransferase